MQALLQKSFVIINEYQAGIVLIDTDGPKNQRTAGRGSSVLAGGMACSLD